MTLFSELPGKAEFTYKRKDYRKKSANTRKAIRLEDGASVNIPFDAEVKEKKRSSKRQVVAAPPVEEVPVKETEPVDEVVSKSVERREALIQKDNDEQE